MINFFGSKVNVANAVFAAFKCVEQAVGMMVWRSVHVLGSAV